MASARALAEDVEAMTVFINHSCEPNCEAWIEEKKIFLYALRDIEAGEELTFDYGFDIENYEDHPCLCGADGCVGYIVSRDQWKELKERLADKEEEEEAAAPARRRQSNGAGAV